VQSMGTCRGLIWKPSPGYLEVLKGQAVQDGTHIVASFVTFWPRGKKK
jgi:hypothetical protein